jgi:hypothetical protein
MPAKLEHLSIAYSDRPRRPICSAKTPTGRRHVDDTCSDTPTTIHTARYVSRTHRSVNVVHTTRIVRTTRGCAVPEAQDACKRSITPSVQVIRGVGPTRSQADPMR